MQLGALDTERLHLRPLAREDAPDLHRAWSDPEVMRYWHLPPAADPDESRQRVEAMLADPTRLLWTIRLRDGGPALGHVGFLASAPGRRAPFGYLLGREQWGRGLVVEAARAAFEAGFSRGRIAGAELWIYEGNERSVRVAEKLGCTLRGRFVAFNLARRARFPTLVYGLTAAELGIADPMPDPVAAYDLHPVLAVPDVGRALAFYCEGLGFHLDWSFGEPPTTACVSRGDWTPLAATIRFALVPDAPTDHASWLAIAVDDVDRLADELRAASVPLAEGPVDRPWGLRELAVVDPFGHRLVFATTSRGTDGVG